VGQDYKPTKGYSKKFMYCCLNRSIYKPLFSGFVRNTQVNSADFKALFERIICPNFYLTSLKISTNIKNIFSPSKLMK
jgi:hypothetical protein